jgi:predicted metalloprotease with PDZ domain
MTIHPAIEHLARRWCRSERVEGWGIAGEISGELRMCGRAHIARNMREATPWSIILDVMTWLYIAAVTIGVRLVAPTDPVVYRVTLEKAGGTSITVSLTLPTPAAGPVALVIPRAVPMGYSQQLYDRYVTAVAGRGADSAPLAVQREDGSRWRIGVPGVSVREVTYRVDLAQMERELLSATDSSRARPGYVGLLGYTVFGYIEGWETRPLRLEVEAPPDWPVFTTLAPAAPPGRRAEGQAADFYALADSQVAMGPDLTVIRLENRVPLYLSAYTEGEVDLPLTGSLVAQAMTALVDYFGSAPFAHYTAVVELLRPISADHNYGFSMEHLSSSHYFLSVDNAILPGSPELQRRRSLYNFVHHLAHAWIPKRAYGKGYFPFSWELAPIIDTIWMSEGFARYVGVDALADTMSAADATTYRKTYLDSMRATLVAIPPFIRDMPLVDLSRIASTRYSEDFRTGRALFARGMLFAAELDEEIRKTSGGTKRFRDAARQLMQWSREHRRGFRIDELPGIFEQATGVKTHHIWQQWLGPSR